MTRHASDTTTVKTTLRPHEALALRVLGEANGVTPQEILRVGLRLLWRLHRQGKFKIPPRLVWRANPRATRRRKPI